MASPSAYISTVDDLVSLGAEVDGAVGGRDGVLRLWDTSSFKLAAELKGHTNHIHCVRFSPDGTLLVTASGDSTVRLWDTRHSHVRHETAQRVARLREKLQAEQKPIPGARIDGPGARAAAWQSLPQTADERTALLLLSLENAFSND